MKRLFFLCSCLLSALAFPAWSQNAPVSVTPESMETVAISTDMGSAMTVSSSMPTAIHAIHVTAWQAGSKKYRHFLADQVFGHTVINAVVIDVKEYEGEVYIPGVGMAERAGAYVPAMPDISTWVSELRKQNIYTVARIVVFKDNIMPRKNPKLAVHNADGGVWLDRTHTTWMDPYNHEAWRYAIMIALQAVRTGFNEVQFDYIRFPTDGNLKGMRFSKPYSLPAASHALVSFLAEAARVLHPLGAKISIDVFGLVTTVNTGMGIGQVIGPMAQQVDYVCPMTYPSHYNRGEYGIANPNDEPYRTVHLAMHDALRSLGAGGRRQLRPYLQDFSLKGRGIRYGAKEVRAQIAAAADQGIGSWTLWNARCVYTYAALRTPIPVASVFVSSITKLDDVKVPKASSGTLSSTPVLDGKHP